MKKYYFKHLILVFIAILAVVFVTSCNKKNDDNNPKEPETLNIYSINDFHGALTETNGHYGIARVAHYIKSQANTNKDASIVLSAGDMFQGSALSNYDHGKTVIQIMNEIGFDAMTLGNHEFDWELKTITDYVNGVANFPMLGCNIIEKSTGKLPNNVEPYVILNKLGINVGIIGYMGYGLEYSIATKMVEGYKFLEPVEVMKDLIKTLRTEKDCKVIICIGHDANDTTNKQLANLSGNEKVDCIINGHTHSQYVEYLTRDDKYEIPVIQSGSVGEYVGQITFVLNDDHTVKSASAKNVGMKRYNEKDSTVDSIVNKLVEDTEPIFGRVLCQAGEYINKFHGVTWAVNALQEYMKCDVAFINGGGIRSNAFPIKEGSNITVSKVYEIMPFDNTIKLEKLQGKYIKSIYSENDIYCSDTLKQEGNTLYINGNPIEDEKYYTVAAVDYIFDKDNMAFKFGTDIEATGILFRDILVNNLEQLGLRNEKWYVKKSN